MGVLGHRQAILAAIKELPKGDSVAQSLVHSQAVSHRHDTEASALKAFWHWQKLVRELEKTEAHAAALNRQALSPKFPVRHCTCTSALYLRLAVEAYKHSPC